MPLSRERPRKGWDVRLGPSDPVIISPNENETIIMMKIDKYETVLVKGRPVTYAVVGKKRYEMPQAYASMYTDDYLAIEERELDFPEVFDVPKKHYIPLYTGSNSETTTEVRE